jgi:hypothetical protein
MKRKTLPSLPFHPLSIIDGPRAHPTLEPNSVLEDWSWHPSRSPAVLDSSDNAGTAALEQPEPLGPEPASDIDNRSVPARDGEGALIETRIVWDVEMQGKIRAFLEALAETTIA